MQGRNVNDTPAVRRYFYHAPFLVAQIEVNATSLFSGANPKRSLLALISCFRLDDRDGLVDRAKVHGFSTTLVIKKPEPVLEALRADYIRLEVLISIVIAYGGG